MLVTKIQLVNKKKSRVFIDESFAFVLYNGELLQYGIREGEELEEDSYAEIINDVLYKRGKARVVHLLASMERTEAQVVRKLTDNGYPREVIQRVINFAKAYGYLDDKRFAASYVRENRNRKSSAYMKAELMQKGISSDVIHNIFQEDEVGDDVERIRYWVEKKQVDIQNSDEVQLRKFYMFLARKGFKGDDIARVLKGNQW